MLSYYSVVVFGSEMIEGLFDTIQAGLHDEWKKSEMKMYCPKCRDLYTPASEYQTPTSMCLSLVEVGVE